VEVPFAVAAARVVTVTSFGGVPLRAELRDDAGHVLARAAGRTDDWNIALSRFLAAGRYRLALAALLPPAGTATRPSADAQDLGTNNDAAANGGGTDNEAASGDAENQPMDQPGGTNSDQDQAAAGQDQAGSGQDQPSAGQVQASGQDNGSMGQDQPSAGEASADQGGADQASTAQSNADQPDADQAGAAQSNGDQANADQANAGQASADQGGQAASDTASRRTEITLFLPPEMPDTALSGDGAMALPGGGIRHVTLPAAPPGSLTVAAAEAPVELILALEQRGADGIFHTLGQSQGLAPVVGIPAGDAGALRRISVWTVDGGAVPIRVAARNVTATPAAIGPVPLAPVALSGITQHWNAALVADPGGLMLRLLEPAAGLLTSSAPDQSAAPPADGTIVAQSAAVWLLAPEFPPAMGDQPGSGTAAVGVAPPEVVPPGIEAGAAGAAGVGQARPGTVASPVQPEPGSVSAPVRARQGTSAPVQARQGTSAPVQARQGTSAPGQAGSDTVSASGQAAPHATLAVVQAGPGSVLTVGVPAAGRAILPIAAATGDTVCAYVATSGLGQPGLAAGRGMDAAQGSAFALCGGATLTAWNAGGDAALRPRLRRYDLAVQPEVAVDQAFAGTLPPHAAVKLRLPEGMKRLDASLAPGGALVAGWQPADTVADAVTVWAGDVALSRSLTGGWTDALLINTGDDPEPVALTVIADAPPPGLAPGGIFRRFFGAGGSFVLPLTARPGQSLVLAGDATASVQRADGQVRQGRLIPQDGPATAVVTHGAGPLALWIEGPGVSPWPDAAPRDVTLPQRLTLDQAAMALRLTSGAPVLLRLTSTGPAILAIGTEPPTLFGKGVALARYLPAGATTLRLMSPQDGKLSGSLELSGSPVIEVSEGLGAPVAIPPGGTAVFGFAVTAAGPVGLGVRADPDRVAVRLLDEHGETLQRGVSMLRHLPPGHYLLEASVPADAPTTLARPAVLGIAPHPNPPPADIVRGLLLAAGFAPPR
jgi:hypothetical protein